MKRAARRRAIVKLYAALKSRDFDAREHALFQLAMLFRLSHRDAASRQREDYETDSLPRELLRIRLHDKDKREAGEEIAKLMRDYPESRGSAIWALSQMEAKYGVLPIMLLCMKEDDPPTDEVIQQAEAALLAWVDSGEIDEENLRMWPGLSDEELGIEPRYT